MKILRARLYELERSKLKKKDQKIEKIKSALETDLKELELIIFLKEE